MKKTVLLFLFMFKFYPSFSQVDTCSIDSTIFNFYHNDALAMTILSMKLDTTNPYYDSIHVPAVQVNRILRTLGMVYYNTSLERDSVINIFNIHNHCGIPLSKSLLLMLDTSLAWVKQFLTDSILSGNPSFDSLIAGNQFKLFTNDTSFNSVFITTDSIYNLQPIINKLRVIPGVIFANENPCAGGGDWISSNPQALYTEVIYALGMGDCPSGCTGWHYWSFKVYPDCSSAFDSSWGNSIIVTELNNPISDNNINLYPNPFNRKITFQPSTELISNPFYTSAERIAINVFNNFGEVVYTKQSALHLQEIDLSGLAGGVYLLQVQMQEKVFIKRIVKIVH